MTTRGRRSALGLSLGVGLCLAVSLVASSCSKKMVAVDPGDGLEGAFAVVADGVGRHRNP
jgi:hypothetical protein